jgi:hypothetical protein
MQTPQNMGWLCFLAKVNVTPNFPKHFLSYSKLGFEEPRILPGHEPVVKNVMTELGVGGQPHVVDLFFQPDGTKQHQKEEKVFSFFLPNTRKVGTRTLYLLF